MSARPHFRLAGTPIRVEPFFWIVVVLMGINTREGWLLVGWVAVVFTSVLVHELGHAVAYRVFGQRASIVLHGFGGLTFGQKKLSRGPSIIVSIAGPVAALALLGVPAKILIDSAWGEDLLIKAITGEVWFGWYVMLDDMVFVSVWWSLANLLPIRPLDGGHVATELIGVTRAQVLSMIFAVGGAIYAYQAGFTYAALLAVLLGFINYSEWRRARQGQAGPSTFDIDRPDPGSTTGRRPNRSRLRSVPTGPSVGPTAVLPPRQGPDPATLETRGWNALRNGDLAGARRVIASSGGAGLSPYLRGSVALASDEPEALDLLAVAFDGGQPPNLVPATILAATGSSLPLAQRLLARPKPAGREAASTLQTNLHYAERFREAAVVGEALHAAGATSPAQTSFEVACAWSRADDVDRAVDWLERAADEGFRAAGLVDGEPDLDNVRLDPRWPLLRARLA